MTRRYFMTAAGGLVVSAALPSFGLVKKACRHDASLVALISDLHINGLKAEFPAHCYEEECLRKTVAAILALDPLPANVVCFGDIAYHWGQPEDYPLVASILKPLEDAGIKLTLGMGNHDRRDNFLAQWPEYAKIQQLWFWRVDSGRCLWRQRHDFRERQAARRGRTILVPAANQDHAD